MSSSFKMPHIFIASHDQKLIQRLGLLCKQSGYHLHWPGHGRAAIPSALERSIDLFVVDEEWNSGSSYEFCKSIKTTKQFAVVPIILLLKRKQREEAFKVLGVERICYQPVDEYFLLSQISGLLIQKPPSFESFDAIVSQRQSRLYRKRVLVGGQDQRSGGLMVRLLQEEDCDVISVNTGQELIRRARSSRPQIIIMDVLLGEGNSSFEIIEAIRADPACQGMPIFIYSFYRVSELGSEDINQRVNIVDDAVEACLQAGATASLGGFSERTFIQRLNQCLAGTKMNDHES